MQSSNNNNDVDYIINCQQNVDRNSLNNIEIEKGNKAPIGAVAPHNLFQPSSGHQLVSRANIHSNQIYQNN